MRVKRDAVTLALCVVVAALLQVWVFVNAHAPLADFRAFWCAGSVLAHGGNPYLAAPLVRCEYADPAFHPYGAQIVAVPAPLPEYALLPFAGMSFLPYGAAAVLWLIVLAGATTGCVLLCAALTRRPVVVCAASFFLPALALWMPYGEVVPIALAGALAAAWGLRLQRMALVAAGLAMLAIEPHLAPGVWIAVAVYERRSRLWIGGLALAFAFIWGVVAKGSPAAYAGAILPMQAYADLPRDTQFSASWIFHALGAGDRIALLLGSVSYLAFAAFGVFVGLVLARRTHDSFVLIATALAGEVSGGAYIHDAQIAVALPAAMLFSDVALLLLAMPWLQLAKEPLLLPVASIGCAIIARYSRLKAVTPTAAALGSALIVLMLLSLQARHPAAATAFPLDSPLASAAWGRYVWSHYADSSLSSWIMKIPTWLGLAILWAVAFKQFVGHQGSSSKRSPTSRSVASSAPAPSSIALAAPTHATNKRFGRTPGRS